MLADCATAKESIVLEQFIFTKDEFGQKIIDICAERAAAGVKVRFLWDAYGSFTFWGSNIVEELRGKGIELVFWKTLVPAYTTVPNARSWFLRNHRRTLVIDEKIGYTGSICIRDNMKDWRDTNARFEGPVVAHMQYAFDRMWARALKRRQLSPRPPAGGPRDHEFSYVTNSPGPGKRLMYRALVEAIRGAEHSVYLTTPYFVPTHRLLRVIKLAAHRGVDVRLLMPERSNYYSVDLGAQSFFTALLESGVRIFLYPNKNGNIIHGKTAVIDGEWATVGSLNLDNVSLLYNFEANIVSTDVRFAAELADHFMRDAGISKEVRADEWKSRFFVEKLPEIAIRLVRRFL
jgi:cardiolipin synthase